MVQLCMVWCSHFMLSTIAPLCILSVLYGMKAIILILLLKITSYRLFHYWKLWKTVELNTDQHCSNLAAMYSSTVVQLPGRKCASGGQSKLNSQKINLKQYMYYRKSSLIIVGLGCEILHYYAPKLRYEIIQALSSTEWIRWSLGYPTVRVAAS